MDAQPIPDPSTPSGKISARAWQFQDVVRNYEARWFDSYPADLILARLLEAARAGSWQRAVAFGASERVSLRDLVPALALHGSRKPREAELIDEVLERLLDAMGKAGGSNGPARALASAIDAPLEARVFGVALIARRGASDAPARWMELLRDERFESARFEGFLGARLDGLSRRLWKRRDGEALAPLVRDPRANDRALRRLCAPLQRHGHPSLELVAAVVARWFHDESAGDPLVCAALAHAGPCVEGVESALLERAARLEPSSESALRALADRRDPRTTSTIGDCLFAPPTRDELRAACIRRAAAAALVRCANRPAAELLLAGSRSTTQPDLSTTCRRALEILRQQFVGLDRMRKALERCDPELRARALALLDSDDFGELLPALIERLTA